MATDYKKAHVYRTYKQAEHWNITKTNEEIHNYLFARNNRNNLSNISKRTRNDAEILNNFFKQYKMIMNNNPKNIEEGLVQGVIFNTAVKIPAINFALGGRAQGDGKNAGGILWEKEIEKLFKEHTISGNTQAASQVQIGNFTAGERNKGQIEEAIKRWVLNNADYEIDDILKNYEQQKINENGNTKYGIFYKTTAKRDGKIDVKGSNIQIEYEGAATGELERALRLLETSSFSLKSYISGDTPSLGSTNPVKAISAITDYVEKNGSLKTYPSKLFFTCHPNKSEFGNGTEPNYQNLYAHYDHMQKIYELTGLGLHYNGIQDMVGVDFLIVNRAKSNTDIEVYATSDLIGNMTKANRFSYKQIYKSYKDIK